MEYYKIISELSQNYESIITKLWVDYHQTMSGLSQIYEWNITNLWVDFHKLWVESWSYKIMSGSIIPGVSQKLWVDNHKFMSGLNKIINGLSQNYECIIKKLWMVHLLHHKIMIEAGPASIIIASIIMKWKT